MSERITARWLITGVGVVEYPVVTVAGDGTIAEIVSDPKALAGETTTLSASLFDVHVHGAAGFDVMEGSAAAVGAVGRFLAMHGVGRFLPTTVTAPVDVTLRALDGIAGAVEAAETTGLGAGAALPVGIHLEGPFISHAKRGVHPVDSIQEPSVELFERMWEAARGKIRLMTVAPERPGALELIHYARDKGVRVSLGHSDATAAEARAGVVAGASSATHTFNAMRRLDHREPGIAGIVLDSEELYAELICDGIHVAPEFVRLWWRAKSLEKGILVTDGISATGEPDGEYRLGEFAVVVRDGKCLLKSDLERGVETLAGSVLTMDRAVENLRRFTGAGLADAVRAASRNPSRMLGMEMAGEMMAGALADLNRWSGDGRLMETWLGGKRVLGA